ncbi:MAG: 5-(carboxyamino)imidazole ribonucleotide mutase [Hydrotalea sp.]|nr:5-(carboxyamino)imidazole ribonucleotide mutase [Hydrotalea sp.]
MGSDSDFPIMSAALKLLEEFGVAATARVVSAHRTPERLRDVATAALADGVQVIIAGAGGAAHLPGMMASFCPLPVLGVPIPTKSLQGLDSLLSIVQMPRGVPVGTLAIGEAGAVNAALLAISILALHDEPLAKKLADFRAKQTAAVPMLPGSPMLGEDEANPKKQ